MKKIFLLIITSLAFLSCQVEKTSQEPKSWVSDNLSEWPQITMINEVWYQGGEQYIHESFEYAGSGFLIENGEDVMAVTAKHVLWIAKPKAMKTVNPNPYLDRWIMHSKGNLADSVVLGELVNTDTSEYLQGPDASIQERDWLVFSTKSVSPNLKVLKPSFRTLAVGEKVYLPSCAYADSTCMIRSATVLRTRGNRIIISKDDPEFAGMGASGSPLVDSAGNVVGIFCGTSTNPNNGDPAFYALNTRYLKKILDGEQNINGKMIPIYDYLTKEIEEKGFEAAVENYQKLVADEENFYRYNISPEALNRVGDDLLKAEKLNDAAAMVEISLSDHPYFSRTHSLLGRIQVAQGEIEKAKSSFNEALKLWPENKEAQEELGKLGE